MAKKKRTGNLLGSWAFLIGVILAVILAFTTFAGLGWLLFVLGLIVGLLNITDEEVQPFMFAGTVLVILAALGGGIFGAVHAYLGNMLNNLLILFVPATVIVTLKHVFSMAKH